MQNKNILIVTQYLMDSIKFFKFSMTHFHRVKYFLKKVNEKSKKKNDEEYNSIEFFSVLSKS